MLSNHLRMLGSVRARERVFTLKMASGRGSPVKERLESVLLKAGPLHLLPRFLKENVCTPNNGFNNQVKMSKVAEFYHVIMEHKGNKIE